MSTINYLAYGSNLWPGRLHERVGAIEVLGTVELTDWCLDFSKSGADGSGKCTLSRAAGQRAFGQLYRMPGHTQTVLDEIEGLGRGYASEWLNTLDFGFCYVYLAMPEYRDLALKPYDWYKTLVVAGARHHEFPQAYVEQLERITAIEDPDHTRAERNLAAMTGSSDGADFAP